MANPQKENGHIQIANEIVDAFIKYFPGKSEGQVLWAILRKTYGWNKKADKISISQIEDMTGISRRMVIYALQNLEAKKMIYIFKEGGEINQISFQKNYDEWVVQEKSVQYDKALKRRKELYENGKKGVVQENEEVVQENEDVSCTSARNGKKVVQETENGLCFLAPTKDTNIQKTITKDIERLSASVIEYFNLKSGKNFKVKSKHIREMISGRVKDGFILEDFKTVIDKKCAQWKDDPKMDAYLRPQTLFRPSNFESYLNEKSNGGKDGFYSREDRELDIEVAVAVQRAREIDERRKNSAPEKVSPTDPGGYRMDVSDF